jgi:hypothetical protein
MDGQIGYALDVINAYKEKKTNDSDIDKLENILVCEIKKRVWLYEKFPDIFPIIRMLTREWI